GIRLSAVLALISFVAVAATSVLLFTTNNYALKTVPILLNILLTFIAIMVYRALTEEKDKQFLKQTFSSYLAPELIDIMYESKQMPKLGGESRVNTAFFTDIQGFSTFSEKLTATQVVELLNEYLGSMTDILLAERGTLDKYIGDAIIGIFGAPMALPDHAFRACKVAIGMQANLGRLREKWAAEKADASEPNRNSKNLPTEEWEPGAKWPRIVWDMRVRVGINSGEMVTGNMGSTMRMNYTMMGDTVNLAARLEAGAKQFGVFTLVAEETLNMSWQDETGTHVVKDMVESRFIDRITVVGKSAPVEVYEVVALKGELTAEQQELFTLFAEGVKHYQNTEWDKALAIFKKTKDMELFPKNKFTPTKMYIERCEEFKVSPPVKPGEKWDGVFRMTQKH
ncbi:MAG: adenylate/guanylate cyclase domain-containing protein, partial [Spirochaetota bacterium]